MNYRSVITPILLLVSFMATAKADITTYFDRSSFEAALYSSQNIDFEDDHPASWNNYSNSSGVTLDGVNFVGNFSLGDGYYLYIGESDSNSWGSSQGLTSGDFLLGEGRGSIDITLPGGFDSLGMDFLVAEGVAAGSLWNVTFELFSGDSFSFDVPAQELQFFGVTSTDGISGINFRTTLDTRPPQIAIDNLTFGTAIPEPGTCTVMSLGFACLVLRRRKS